MATERSKMIAMDRQKEKGKIRKRRRTDRQLTEPRSSLADWETHSRVRHSQSAVGRRKRKDASNKDGIHAQRTGQARKGFAVH